MSTPLYDYPKKALFNRVIPKNKFYEYGSPGKKVKDFFVSQISQILWQYKLAPETINLPSRSSAPEIQIFSITLKNGELSNDVLQLIDRSILAPIFYELNYNNKIKVVAAYKRPSEADKNKWVIEAYFESDWIKNDTERTTLPVALDLGKLYEQMLRKLMPLPPRNKETLREHAERLSMLQKKQVEYDKIALKLEREKQFNRKVEINSQLKNLKQIINELSS